MSAAVRPGFSLAAVMRQHLAESGWPADPQNLESIARRVAIQIPPEYRAAAWIEVLSAYARHMRRSETGSWERFDRPSPAGPGTGMSRSAKVDRIREAWAPYLRGSHPAVHGKVLGDYGPDDLIAVAEHSEDLAAAYGSAAELCRGFAGKMTAAGVQRVADMPEDEHRAAFADRKAVTA